ncbi:MAG TPA: nicotinamide-nucleotide amidohydrolase family protein [Bordetella sp.]|nr:nicotinamide-nucleotide amidohydrolase family protein [Bordetella sp.]
MTDIAEIAAFMRERSLTLATVESCTAGLIAATLANIPGAGALLDCAFVVYSPDAKHRCVGVPRSVLEKNNLTSEVVARAMALGAAARTPANIIIANTGITEAVDDEIPAGTQCFAWAFKAASNDAAPVIYTGTRRFTGTRHRIRQAAANHALLQLRERYLAWQRSCP